MNRKRSKGRNGFESGASAAHLATRPPPDSSVDEIMSEATPEAPDVAVAGSLRDKDGRSNNINRTDYRNPRYHHGWPSVRRVPVRMRA
jgi:hypothetical protein